MMDRDAVLRLAEELEAVLEHAQHADKCLIAYAEMVIALADLPAEERKPGDTAFRCSCSIGRAYVLARQARVAIQGTAAGLLPATMNLLGSLHDKGCVLCGRPPAPYPNWMLCRGIGVHVGCLGDLFSCALERRTP